MGTGNSHSALISRISVVLIYNIGVVPSRHISWGFSLVVIYAEAKADLQPLVLQHLLFLTLVRSAPIRFGPRIHTMGSIYTQLEFYTVFLFTIITPWEKRLERQREREREKGKGTGNLKDNTSTFKTISFEWLQLESHQHVRARCPTFREIHLLPVDCPATLLGTSVQLLVNVNIYSNQSHDRNSMHLGM